jgi:hypothetical protein
MRGTLLGISLMLVVVMVMVMMVIVSSAWGNVAWRIDSAHAPANLPPGGSGQYIIQPYNTGSTAADLPFTVVDVLPPNVTAEGWSGLGWDCDSATTFPATTVTCTGFFGFAATTGTAPPDFRGPTPTLFFNVVVAPGATGTADNQVTISDGDSVNPVTPVSRTDPTTFDTAQPGFGLINNFFGAEAFDAAVPAGTLVRQAGGHPFEARFDLDFNLKLTNDPVIGTYSEPDDNAKDVEVKLPAGFVGNPEATSKCTDAELSTPSPLSTDYGSCPIASQVGSMDLVLNNGQHVGEIFSSNFPNASQDIPVYNMVPPKGAVADFAFVFQQFPIHITASLDPTDHYAVKTTTTSTTALFPIRSAHLALWGVPADPAHDPLRFNAVSTYYGVPAGIPVKPFLTLPSQCDTATSAKLRINSWQHPDVFKSYESALVTPTGCDKQKFNPSIDASPTTLKPDAPSGLSFDLNVPQDQQPGGFGTPPLKKVVVTLPEGMAVSPSSADGLAACTPAQIGLGTNDPPRCPDAAKIGTTKLITPLLPDPVDGDVYLAAQNDNPFGSLLALYIVFQDPDRGLVIKLPGKIEADPSTGRLKATFDENPQLPFSNLHMALVTGARAPLVTPMTCGLKTTTAELTSWNEVVPVVTSTSSFTISADGKGAPCQAPGFDPSFKAGTTNPVAGGFSPLALRLQRSDNDQEFRSLTSLSLPPGLLADVGSVSTRCTEDQARAAACPAASHIGTVNVGAGAGPNPFYVPGDVYLMSGFTNGPFKGDPFGLAVVVHAKAGPFDLGYVVVKAGIQVHDDGSITTQTEPFPTILQGIPLQVKDIRVNLDRPGFIFNPTNCNPLSINGTVLSTENQQAGVASRFQVGECATLAFNPRFSASTQGNGTFNHNGASFDVKLATGQGPESHEANIRKVEVQLPKALPARLTTLQKACTEQQFATNPAGCPVASNVGTVVAHTPILAAPLAGPAYLVSHGGAAFPDLVLVLQGEGIVLHVTGHTQIKKGITYSRFETIPDAPITSFELKLPEGPFSALAANANLCRTTTTKTVRKRVTVRVHGRSIKRTRSIKSTVAAPLSMPTTITAQNGMVLKQATKIAVTGCAKTIRAKVRKATKKGHKH